MSRKTIYQDQRLVLVTGHDHMLGDFIQLYDNDLISETPEGEGLIFDWSQGFGVEINYTGINLELKPLDICLKYIEENKENHDL